MATDEYERHFMDSGAIRYREKHVARIFVGAFGVLAAAIAAVGVLLLAQGGAAIVGSLIPFAVSAVLVLVALYFAVMRVTVSNTHLAVAYGTIDTHVPLAAITSAVIEKRTGLGPKYDGRGWNYGPLGTSAGVRVEWSEGGKTTTCYVGATDPDALLRSIDEGRSAARVRVGATSSGNANAESDAVEPVDAVLEQRRSERS